MILAVGSADLLSIVSLVGEAGVCTGARSAPFNRSSSTSPSSSLSSFSMSSSSTSTPGTTVLDIASEISLVTAICSRIESIVTSTSSTVLWQCHTVGRNQYTRTRLGMAVNTHISMNLGQCCCTTFHSFQDLLMNVSALKRIHLSKPRNTRIEIQSLRTVLIGSNRL